MSTIEVADRRPSGACPTFFRAACREASQGGRYADAGYALAGATSGLLDEDQETNEAILAELAAALYRSSSDRRRLPPDDDAVLAWFDRELPRCMALIPKVRRKAFLGGIYQWAIEEENDIAAS